MSKVTALNPEELALQCDPDSFSFKTTADIEPLSGVIGQARALSAIDFGLGIGDGGYNIYVLGESGTGKASIIKALLEEKSKDEPVPDDWCYVFNFTDADRPTTLRLPPGKGAELKQDMEELIETLRRDIPSVFESKDYEKHRDEILGGQQERTKSILHRLEKMAGEKNFVLKKNAAGLSVVPAKDGKPLKQKEFEALGGAEREKIDVQSRLLQGKLSDAVREVREIEKNVKQRVSELDREVVQYVVNPLINELIEKYREFENVVTYLVEVKENLLSSIDDFRVGEEPQLPFGLKMPFDGPSFVRYRVNLFVSNENTTGAPVVVETNPTYYNLFGRVEHMFQYGVASTDFSMMRSGAVQRANGGYLVVNALDVLKNLFVYDAIKRMIKTRQAGLDDIWDQYRPVSSTTLKPDPVPMDIKVVMIGEPIYYYLLYRYDPEYRKLFKVKADFDNVMDRGGDSIESYVQFIALRCRENKLLAFDRSGVARVVEYGSRLAANNEKLSARFGAVDDLIIEASYFAGVYKAEVATAEHVERAIKEKIYRNSKVEEKLRDYIIDDTFMVSTEGSVVGQVNGLAVLNMGDYAFGKPSRITAKTFMGDDGIVGIEREVKMSGKIHNKSQFILRSFLGERFATDFPLSFSASLCFEQLYDEIEGDSATCTEVYALLSSLSLVPIKQSLSVTGSMNQLGEVQPIGGVNEKIEGFFDVCSQKGLTGDQGVIIPKRNVRNLMLKKEVVEAARDGKFFIYPIEMVDEGLEILTGKSVGKRGKDGKFPEGSVNFLAEQRLRGLAKSLKAFGRPKPKSKDGRKKTELKTAPKPEPDVEKDGKDKD